jgi:hypothetical protein
MTHLQIIRSSVCLRITIISLCFFVIRLQAITTNSAPLFKFSDVVPVGKHDLEFQTLQISERGLELMAKFQSAVASNRDWFMEYTKNAAEGPLPYDEKLGLTKAEYAEYLGALKNRQLISTKTSIPCLFQHDGNILTLHLAETDTPISKIKLNLETGELTASVGAIGKPDWISNDGSSGVLGAYDACSWRYEKSDLEKYDVRLFKLDIWRLKPSGRILWHIQDSELVNKESKQAFEVVFEPQPANPRVGIASNVTQTNARQSPTRLETAFEICGTIWSCTWIAAVITALLSALLCFFPRTLRTACRLGQIGLWLGIVAILAAVIGIRLAALQAGLSSNTNGDNLSLVMMTASAPLLAFITTHWSRRKLKLRSDVLTTS